MESGHVYSAISRGWRALIGDSHDYAIIRNDSAFRTGFHDRFVYESRYAQAEEQLHAVLASYDGCTLDEIFQGHECETYEGTCYCIPSREPVNLNESSKTTIRSAGREAPAMGC